MRDMRRKDTYTAENVFIGTVMWEQPGFDALVEQTKSIVSSPNWVGHFGHSTLGIERINDSNTTLQGLYSPRKHAVSYHDTAHLAAVPHELAHAAHALSGRIGTPHGREFRGWHITILRWGYGEEPADILAQSYRNMGLAVTLPQVIEIKVPAIHVDDRPVRVWV